MKRLVNFVAWILRNTASRGNQRSLRRVGVALPEYKADTAGALDLLSALNVATTLQDLSPLKSVGLHKLKGDRKGQWAMTVNARWHLVEPVACGSRSLLDGAGPQLGPFRILLDDG